MDWNASGTTSGTEETRLTRVYSPIGPRTPTSYKFVVVELYLYNSGDSDINTDDIWLNEFHHLSGLGRGEDNGLGIEVMGRGSNMGILDLDVNINPRTGEQDGCSVSGDWNIPDSWIEGTFDIYVPPGGNLPWKPCFTVPEEDISTLVLKWPHFVDGPAIWFALHPE